MLAPIVTKDMRLFPTHRIPQMKNVRSRAQTLDKFQQIQNSLSTIDRLVPVKPRTCQSTGNISSSVQRSTISRTTQKVGQSQNTTKSANQSPPKSNSSTRKTHLSAIQEGIEMSDGYIPHSKSESSSVQSEVTLRNIKHFESEDSEEDGSPPRRSHTHQNININNNNKNINNNNKNINNNNNQNPEEKKKRGVLKWITNTFRKSSREKPEDSASTTST